MAILLRRLGIYGVVALVIAGVTLVAVLGYRLYYDHLADTPERAVRTYLETLNNGDMMKLYDLSRGASSQTQAEFAIMVSSILKDKRLTTDPLAVESIGRQGNVHYFRVMGRLRASDGSYRLLPLFLESGQEGAVWRVSMYLPPAALPSPQ
jgi:hypothetical protein